MFVGLWSIRKHDAVNMTKMALDLLALGVGILPLLFFDWGGIRLELRRANRFFGINPRLFV
jgi:hypothetical protein